MGATAAFALPPRRPLRLGLIGCGSRMTSLVTEEVELEDFRPGAAESWNVRNTIQWTFPARKGWELPSE